MPGIECTVPDYHGGRIDLLSSGQVDIVDVSRRAHNAAVMADKNLRRIGREARGDVGKYIWAVYQLMTYPFINASVSASNVARLVYLSTYTNYHGELVCDNGRPVTKGNLSTVLSISSSAADLFYKESVEAGYIKDNGEMLLIDKDVFLKGRLPSKKVALLSEQDTFVTKLYINGVRSLYEKTASPRQHKTLSYLFQILPFVNREYNIVCFNPLEADPAAINCMTIGDFCTVIGQDRSNAARVAKTLFQPKFCVGDTEQYAVRYVIDKTFAKAGYSIFINPNVYYAGSSLKLVDALSIFKG